MFSTARTRVPGWRVNWLAKGNFSGQKVFGSLVKRKQLVLIMTVTALLDWQMPAVPLGGTIEGLGGRTILSDPRSNTVRVLSSRSDLDKKTAIIAKLDPVVPQILVEAVILEIPSDSLTNLYSTKTQPSLGAEGAFDFNWCINFRAASRITFIPGEATIRPRAPRNEFSILGSLSHDLDTMVSMMATNSTVKILQRPRIQASDGVPIYFSVGQPQLFPVGSLGSGYCGCYYSVQSSETRVGLTVTCSVTTNGSFLVDLVQEVEVPAGSVTLHDVGDVPVTTCNKLRASVTLGSSETLLLGGCITAIKTPVLSRLAALDKIPKVGDYLNKLITYPIRKTNVERIVLIRPTVLSIR